MKTCKEHGSQHIDNNVSPSFCSECCKYIECDHDCNVDCPAYKNVINKLDKCCDYAN